MGQFTLALIVHRPFLLLSWVKMIVHLSFKTVFKYFMVEHFPIYLMATCMFYKFFHSFPFLLGIFHSFWFVRSSYMKNISLCINILPGLLIFNVVTNCENDCTVGQTSFQHVVFQSKHFPTRKFHKHLWCARLFIPSSAVFSKFVNHFLKGFFSTGIILRMDFHST